MIILSVVVCKQLQLALGPGIAALWITLTNIAVPLYLKVGVCSSTVRMMQTSVEISTSISNKIDSSVLCIMPPLSETSQ